MAANGSFAVGIGEPSPARIDVYSCKEGPHSPQGPPGQAGQELREEAAENDQQGPGEAYQEAGCGLGGRRKDHQELPQDAHPL